MNRLLKGLVLFLVALLLVFSFCACKQETETEHTEHIWDSPVVTKKPTCTEKGSQTLTCSVCGATKSEDIPATGHTYSEAWEHDETYHWHLSSCEHEGLKGSFEPHEWKNPVVTKESSWTEEGSVTYTCKCGAEKTEAIPCHTRCHSTGKSSITFHLARGDCRSCSKRKGNLK